MTKFIPEFRIFEGGTGMFTLFCDSFGNKSFNIVDGFFVKKPTSPYSKHKNFAQYDSPDVCAYCSHYGCEGRTRMFNIHTINATVNGIKCPMCDTNGISFGFFLIFSKLKKAGLLPSDYKIECCFCRERRKRLGIKRAVTLYRVHSST